MNLVDPHQRQLSRTLWGARTIAVIITLAFLALLGRVGQLMWQTDPELQAHAGSRASADPLLSRRGAILDRNGRTLAVSRVGYRLFVDPALIDDDTEFAFTLARGHRRRPGPHRTVDRPTPRQPLHRHRPPAGR
jgi:cell division protein FtsI/penicillin-binding protein 2